MSAMGRWDFFLSYAAEDRLWAEWLAWQLESAHYRVLIRAWDFVPGSNWSLHIQQGVVGAERTIVVLSAAYLRSLDDTPEWQAAFAADPSGAGRRLLPVRVEDCELPGLLKQLAPIDLFDQPADSARDTLIALVRHAIDGRAKPNIEPAFPAQAQTRLAEPAFPSAPTGCGSRAGSPATPPTGEAASAWRRRTNQAAGTPRPPVAAPGGPPRTTQPRPATMLAIRPGSGNDSAPSPPNAAPVSPLSDPAARGPEEAARNPGQAARDAPRANPPQKSGRPAAAPRRRRGGSWATLPADRVIRLADTVEPAVRAALDPLPADAPAVLGYRPDAQPSLAACQRALLADLESVAVALFPDWLPGAEVIESAGGVGVAAARALASRSAAALDVFGPYLADLAERSLRGAPTGTRFTVEVRAAGVAKAIAAGFGRERLVLLVDPGASGGRLRDRRTALDALAWFAYTARVGVWLTGLPDGPDADRARTVSCPASGRPAPADGASEPAASPLPGEVATPTPATLSTAAINQMEPTAATREGRIRARSAGAEPARPQSTWRAPAAPPSSTTMAPTTTTPTTATATDEPGMPAGGDDRPNRVVLPAVVGRPHPASRAEKRLEGALRAKEWAHGRAWNQPYRSGPLTGLHYLDLIWSAERVVIEVDGPEHRGVAHYESDRRRDAELVLDGFAVLRFTNDQVLDDVDAVASQIERCVEARRKTPKEA